MTEQKKAHTPIQSIYTSLGNARQNGKSSGTSQTGGGDA